MSQAYDDLTDQWGLSCGVIQASPTRPVNPYRPVQVASIQTLLARDLRPANVKLVVADECHHALSTQWMSVFEHYKKLGAWGVGLTATPVRADGLPLGEVFDALAQPVTVRELIAGGFLVPFELLRPKRELKRGQIAQSPVDALLSRAKDRKTIVFAPGKRVAESFVTEFVAKGVAAGWVHGDMDTWQRRDALRRYASGELQVLVNVGILTEGWDDRPTSCVIIARKVGSLSLLLQIIGRGLRASPETGKVDCIIFDLHGSTHGREPDRDFDWSLDGDGVRKKALETSPERFCAFCSVLLEDDATVCPDCGLERQGQTMPEVVNAELVRYAWKRREGAQERAATLARWLKEGRAKGWKEGAAYHKFQAVYGERVPTDVKALALAFCHE